MAKTKLLQAVLDNMTATETALEAVAKNLDVFAPKDSDAKRVRDALKELLKAVHNMDLHLANLERRQNDPKVTDRLRNLKNVFKDKTALAASRKSAAEFFKSQSTEIEQLEQKVEKALFMIEAQQTLQETGDAAQYIEDKQAFKDAQKSRTTK